LAKIEKFIYPIKFKKTIIVFVCVNFSLFHSFGLARGVAEFNQEVVVEKVGAEAKQEAFEVATEMATRKVSESLLGSERTQQIWADLRAKILKGSTRYVVFIRGTPSGEQTPESTKIQVQLRISPDNLEGVLREVGAYASMGSVRVLPLIQIQDGQGVFAWWVDGGDRTSAHSYFMALMGQLTTQFKGRSVFVMDPLSSGFRMGVPSTYRTATLRREDQMLLAQYLKADVVLSGKVDVMRPKADAPEYRIVYEIKAWQARSGRSVGEWTRQELVASDVPKVISGALEQSAKRVFAETATAVQEAVGKGQLNLNSLRLAVSGNLNYKQMNEFKKQLTEVREIKSLRERLFEPSRVTFEAEVTGSSQDLATSMRRSNFPMFRVDVGEVQDDSLVLNVKAMTSTSAQ